MKKIYKNGLFMLAAGALVASCADYNVTDNFIPESGGADEHAYSEYSTVNSYIDRSKYPNFALGAALSASDFKSQGLAHAAAVTNFDYVSLGSSMMGGKFMKANGVKDFTDMQDILEHAGDIGFEVYGSPIAANSNQPDSWLERLTAPIQIFVEQLQGKQVDYTTMSTFEGTTENGTAGSIDASKHALKIPIRSNVRIIEGFDVDPNAKYTFTITALTEAASGSASFNVNFAGKKLEGPGAGGSWSFGAGGWRTFVVENVRCPEDATEGYLTIENSRSGVIYISNVDITYFPDDHRDQTEKEINDTINYALNTWCDALMQYNDSRIKSFDLIEDAIDAKNVLENGYYDLKHSSDKYFWQDIFGSENYAPKVSKAATEAYKKYGGDVNDLKFFIAESNLVDEKKMESLTYWINIWENNGAKIDGINAKLPLTYSEDAETQTANIASVEKLINSLVATGKLVRISNFDIKYQDAAGKAVTAEEVTDAQRDKIAAYYAHVIKYYLEKVPSAQQAGICKGNILDTGDPVGLWALKQIGKNKDWVRTASYKAFCDALSGK